MREFGNDILQGVREESFKTKTGRPGKVRTASAAGESFASQSEHYINNLDIVEEKSETRVTVFVGVKDTPYAYRLEVTLNRPTWAIVAKRSAKAFRNRFRKRRRGR